MLQIRHYFTALFLIFSQSDLYASQVDLNQMKVSGELSDIAGKSFRLTENLKMVLDGSKDASDIARQSSVTNSIVFLSDHRWRVRRKLPFIESQKEVLFQDGTFSIMTPTNRRISARSVFTHALWEEVVLSPLRLAKEWSLVDQSTTFDELISKLKKSPQGLTNVDGDKIEFTALPDDGYRIISTGRIIQDGKTRVKVESSWELKDRGKIKEADLAVSLARSE